MDILMKKFLGTYVVQKSIGEYYTDHAFIDAKDCYDAVNRFFDKLSDKNIVKLMVADLDHVYKAPL
jgi:hypothetical protein